MGLNFQYDLNWRNMVQNCQTIKKKNQVGHSLELEGNEAEFFFTIKDTELDRVNLKIS